MVHRDNHIWDKQTLGYHYLLHVFSLMIRFSERNRLVLWKDAAHLRDPTADVTQMKKVVTTRQAIVFNVDFSALLRMRTFHENCGWELRQPTAPPFVLGNPQVSMRPFGKVSIDFLFHPRTGYHRSVVLQDKRPRLNRPDRA